ncbi:hypothetical protein SAMN04488136_105181 [Vibrio xiamenensis]|uniref:30S ribosomal protein S6 modification protein n=1 Tax=Vibrio xiamenensis TaxID=861298 RepID=A0A1G7YJU8_9VIBR|nr:30S ribosomal protein S6 modification protein [Vibrio xiamenensis]SDG96822.1 hypothetical protein SAMN04488136_105181 [Vibrio xiamenensis]
MFHQSKIVVCYQIANQKFVLGEALSTDKTDVISLWWNAPEEQDLSDYNGYLLSLFDDDGRAIAEKAVSDLTADAFLSGGYMNKAS